MTAIRCPAVESPTILSPFPARFTIDHLFLRNQPRFCFGAYLNRHPLNIQIFRLVRQFISMFFEYLNYGYHTKSQTLLGNVQISGWMVDFNGKARRVDDLYREIEILQVRWSLPTFTANYRFNDQSGLQNYTSSTLPGKPQRSDKKVDKQLVKRFDGSTVSFRISCFIRGIVK